MRAERDSAVEFVAELTEQAKLEGSWKEEAFNRRAQALTAKSALCGLAAHLTAMGDESMSSLGEAINEWELQGRAHAARVLREAAEMLSGVSRTIPTGAGGGEP